MFYLDSHMVFGLGRSLPIQSHSFRSLSLTNTSAIIIILTNTDTNSLYENCVGENFYLYVSAALSICEILCLYKGGKMPTDKSDFCVDGAERTLKTCCLTFFLFFCFSLVAFF